MQLTDCDYLSLHANSDEAVNKSFVNEGGNKVQSETVNCKVELRARVTDLKTEYKVTI